MKKLLKIFKALLLVALINISFSCSEDFIELAPVSTANVNSFYKTHSDMETAIVGVYNQWTRLFNTTWTTYTEYRGDTYTWPINEQYEVSENKFQLNTTSGFWDDLYKIITYSNVILSKIDDAVFFDESQRDRIRAEAYFFRAEAYFALVRLFGGVPLIDEVVTSSQALTIGRSTPLEIFGLIESDYLAAIDNLPTTLEASEYGRITRYGAEGELARVYITLSGAVYNQDRWSDAIPLLEDILFSSPYSFGDTYQEIFADDGSNEKGEEIILSAIFKAGVPGVSSGYARSFTIYASGTSSRFEPGVYESYESGDLRRDVNLVPSYTDPNGVFLNLPGNVKFDMLFDQSSQSSGMDFPILRYTDVYLLYAESLAEIAGNVPTQSLDILNEVRNRAGLSSLSTTDIPDLSSFRMAMERERRFELMFECVRWFDLVRTGRAVEVLNGIGKNATSDWLLFPIPQTEIDKMGSDLLPQNSGY